VRHDAPSTSTLSRHPWLLDASAWTLESGPGEPTADQAGVWPIGNGWVFAHAGLVRPYNRLSGLTGPTYQAGAERPGGAGFSDCWVELRTERGALSSKQGVIGRPRESGILVTAEGGRGAGAAVVTIDFAPADNPVLIRIVEVWGGARLGEDAMLLVHLPGGVPHDERRRSLRQISADGRVLILAALAPGRWAEPGQLGIRLAQVSAEGSVWRLPLVLAFGVDETDAVACLRQPFDVTALLEQTRAHWRLWLAHTRTPDLWPQNLPGPTATTRSLADLIEAAKVSLKMHVALPGGAICPMVRQDTARAREATGPVRAFLAMGARDEALDILEYHYRASLVLGRIADAAPVDLEMTGVGERADWGAIPVPATTGPAHLVLQHRWWLEGGGDPDVVRRHWPYLVRCAVGRTGGPGGLLPFDGDESYLHGALYAVYPHHCGWPNDLVADEGDRGYAAWALDATAAAAAAHDAIAWMGQQIGQDDGARRHASEAARLWRVIESRFWVEQQGYYAPAIYPLSGAAHDRPFAPINLAPQWIGAFERSHPHTRSNLEAVVDLIGFTGITPNCDYTVGAAPGYLLGNLLQVGSDLAPLALANLVAMASPAGDWAEVYGPGGAPYAGGALARPGRARPAETGISLDALYGYFAARRSWSEPTADFRGVTRRGRTFGPGPSRAAKMVPEQPGERKVIVVTADGGDIAVASQMPESDRGRSVMIVEPGRPFGPDYFARILFDGAGRRTADVLILGASALAGDRRSMKPARFWESAEIVGALQRFAAAGGRVVRPARSTSA
jgi:hypothetical protein